MERLNPKVKKVKTDGVLENYPSFSEIVNNPKYKYHILCSERDRFFLNVITSKWEFVVRGVDRMCREMYELPFYESYLFQPTKDPYNFDRNENIDGVGYVYDSRGDTHEVDYETFLKLTLVLYFGLLGLEQTDEQYQSYHNFKDSSDVVNRILD